MCEASGIRIRNDQGTRAVIVLCGQCEVRPAGHPVTRGTRGFILYPGKVHLMITFALGTGEDFSFGR